jgi:ABC-type spermidine/putrescine transport system permease subunit II
MTWSVLARWALRSYVGLFLAYLFLPLLLMSVIAFNDSRLPALLPWHGFTWRWFGAIGQDGLLLHAAWNSLVIGGFVVLLSVPLGLGAAIMLHQLSGRLRASVYAILVSPILTPGIIIGISALVFWQERFDVSAGFFVTVLAQTSFVASYAMLFIGARLQRFDFTLVEAALDLGASHWQVFRRITLPLPDAGDHRVGHRRLPAVSGELQHHPLHHRRRHDLHPAHRQQGAPRPDAGDQCADGHHGPAHRGRRRRLRARPPPRRPPRDSAPGMTRTGVTVAAGGGRTTSCTLTASPRSSPTSRNHPSFRPIRPRPTPSSRPPASGPP